MNAARMVFFTHDPLGRVLVVLVLPGLEVDYRKGVSLVVMEICVQTPGRESRQYA